MGVRGFYELVQFEMMEKILHAVRGGGLAAGEQEHPRSVGSQGLCLVLLTGPVSNTHARLHAAQEEIRNIDCEKH